MIPKFVAEDLLLGRTAAMVPEFAVKNLPLGRTLGDDVDDHDNDDDDDCRLYFVQYL